MFGNLFHIKINSSEANKDAGFFALMTSGASIVCLKDEEYIIPANAVDKLNERKILYEIVTKKEVSKERGELKTDAPQT
ncbi:MAG: hypothetical protein AABW47_02230 [Nanoarchaeota archaeon]